MSDAARLPGFVTLSTFARAARNLLTDEDVAAIERLLIASPHAGDVMPGTGGVRKIRVGLSGRGKRGGARVIYYLRSTIGRIYLITVYAKNEKSNLTAAERATLRQLTAVLDREL